MSKWKCENPKCKKPCYAEPPERCYPTGCLLSKNNKPNWRKEDAPAITSSQLPKLTAEVFNRPDCPAWAKWAAVDGNGAAFYYDEKPYARNYTFHSWDRMKFIDNNFIASDWKNSLIERSEKNTLPDWCKVGDWMWIKDFNAYFRVDSLDGLLARGKDFCGSNYSVAIENIRQARLRPYNAEEMRGLVGKVLIHPRGDYLVTFFSNKLSQIKVAESLCDANELLQNWVHLDKTPCGVLEHLENGKWLE